MNPLAAGGGGALGGMLGQVSDVLSMPRRALWGGVSSLLGQETPDSGADLVGKLTGMDSTSALARALGFGAEVATDPLSYAGLAMGSPLFKAARAPWLAEAGLTQKIGELEPLVARGQNAIDAEQAFVNATLKPHIGQFAGDLQASGLNLPSIAAGDVMRNNDAARLAMGQPARASAWATSPAEAQSIMNAGLGEMQGGNLVTFGSELPPGIGMAKARGPGGKMLGTGPAVQPGGIPPDATLIPGERQYMMDMQKAGMAQPAPTQFSAFGAPPDAATPIAEDLIIQRMSQALAQRPESSATFGSAIGSPIGQKPSQFSAFGLPPTQTLPPMQIPGNAPVDGLGMMRMREGQRALLSELEAAKHAIGQYGPITPDDWLKIIDAGLLGVAGGTIAGVNGY